MLLVFFYMVIGFIISSFGIKKLVLRNNSKVSVAVGSLIFSILTIVLMLLGEYHYFRVFNAQYEANTGDISSNGSDFILIFAWIVTLVAGTPLMMAINVVTGMKYRKQKQAEDDLYTNL